MKYEVITLFFHMTVFGVYSERSELNQYCQIRSDCEDIGYICWSNFSCQCQSPAYVPNWEKGKCLGTIDQRCKYDDNCIEGAYCFQQKICQCKDDYYPTEDKTMCSNAKLSANIILLHPLLLFTSFVLLGLG